MGAVIGAVVLTALAGGSVGALFAGATRHATSLPDANVMLFVGIAGCSLNVLILFGLFRALGVSAFIGAPTASVLSRSALPADIPQPKHEQSHTLPRAPQTVSKISVETLTDLYKTHTQAQADGLFASVYRGHLITVSGSLLDVVLKDFGVSGQAMVHMRYSDRVLIALLFQSQWVRDLKVLQKDSTFSVRGEIQSAGETTLQLGNCELCT